jgi:PST family polysaccharide transporter
LQSVPVDSKSGAKEPGERHSATLAQRAVIGAIWTITTSIGSRVIGLVGTLLLTRFLEPEVLGETSIAAVVVLTAHVVSNCGLSQYIVARPNEGRAAAFHATFYFLLLGAIALGVAVLLGGPLGSFFHAPGIVKYIPGMALAMLFERVATIQDRILVRDMRFRSVSLQRSFGEIVYAVVSVALAGAGCGGAALIWASLARSILRFITLSLTSPRREWLEPCRITWERTREFFVFGLPMSVASIAGFGSRRWDNLVISGHFGPAVVAFYNYAYQLADIPATLIGETLGDVLVPSFAEMTSDERRKKALLLSMRILILIVAPLAIGLGTIAPTVVETLFDPRWTPVANMLVVLSMLSIVRPIGWIGSSYLQVKNRPREIMILEVTKTIGLLALMLLFQNLYRIAEPLGYTQLVETLALRRHASLWACTAVGVAFALNSLGYIWVIKRVDGISLRDQIVPLLPPVIACVPMVLAVLGLRHAFEGRGLPKGVGLAAETAIGAIVFIPSALLIAPSTSKDLLALLRSALLRRRKGRSAAPELPDGPIATPPDAVAVPAVAVDATPRSLEPLAAPLNTSSSNPKRPIG